jgi:aminopeptidase
LERYADVMIWALQKARTNAFEEGDIILIRYHKAALPLAEVLYRRCLEMGLMVEQRLIATPTMEKDFFKLGNADQLAFISPGERRLYRKLNGSIFLYAPDAITHLNDIDSTRIVRRAIAQKPLRDILNKREANGDFGWTLALFPTNELAGHANLSTLEYERQVAKACYLNRRDPLAHWEEIYQQVNHIKQWLNNLDVKSVHIQSAGTDLKIGIGDQRRWIGLSGHNIPSFEIFTSPDWRQTVGTYFADQTSYRQGNLVCGVRLVFEGGRVKQAQAVKGETFLLEQIAMDRGAGRVGEFSLTDKRFSKINHFMANTLYDENFGGKHGNCHLALGSAYADAFAADVATLTKTMKNKLGFNDSALHWDLVNTEKKQVVAHLKTGKKEVIYENGSFQF